MLRPTLAAVLALVSLTPVLAHDTGEFGQVSPEVHEWFESRQAPNGAICCDVADGHRTTWRVGRTGGYEVMIEGQWVPVPPEAVLPPQRNPVGGDIVWYTKTPYGIHIWCFLQDGGA